MHVLSQCKWSSLAQITMILEFALVPLMSALAHNGNLRNSERVMNSDGHQSSSSNYHQPLQINHPAFTRMNRCYSCMSPVYQEFFREENSHLSKFFYEPRNFTSQCDEPMNPAGMGVVPCRAICLTLTQEFIVMGRKTGKQLTMRGCATSLSRFGFYNRTIALFDQYDLCREVLANELFKYDTDSQPLQVCSCLGDRCNHASAIFSRHRFICVSLLFRCLFVLLSERIALLFRFV